MNSIVSVIVPIYNVEKYLNRCVDSIIRQTYYDLEIILVDDGSPDKCPQICDEYAKADPRIKAIHKTNGGLSSARNAGLDVCKGDFILFVDSDDFIASNAVEVAVGAIEESETDIVAFPFFITKEEQQPNCDTIRTLLDDGCEIIDSQSLLSEFNVKWEKVLIVAWNKMYRKSVFEKVRFIEGVYHEDEYAIVDIIHAAKSVCCINTPLYYYYLSDNSIMRNASTEITIKKQHDYLDMCYLRSTKFIELSLIQQAYYYIWEYIVSLVKNYKTLQNEKDDFWKTQMDRIKKIQQDQVFVKKLNWKKKIILFLAPIMPGLLSKYFL